MKSRFRFAGMVLACLLLQSCATYRQQAQDYYYYLKQGNYQKAETSLEHTRILKKERNHLLLLLEKGKLEHLQGHWEESNTAFNEADNMMEDQVNKTGDFITGTLLNPMMSHYRPEGFERYLVHYYKAINYLQLGQTEEAVVEARRISLSTYALQDEQKNQRKYSDDAFAYMMQAMIYEKAGDINNAFIACRNAVDLFTEKGGVFYGTAIPFQVKKDLLRLAVKNGFTDELNRYQSLFGMTYTPDETPAGGELILFWENGSAPVKEQKEALFSLLGESGNYYFRDNNNLYNIPAASTMSLGSLRPGDLGLLHIALPAYRPPVYSYGNARLQSGGILYPLEKAADINTMAITSLNERMLKELGSALTRMVVKKITEEALRPKDNNKKDEKPKTEEEKKKEQKAKNAQNAVYLGMQIFNMAREKADTRNWQSLPASIYYVRIPLVPGENKLTLQLSGPQARSVDMIVQGNGTMQFRNLCTIEN